MWVSFRQGREGEKTNREQKRGDVMRNGNLLPITPSRRLLLIACSIPLKQGKSIREAMKERGVLQDYLAKHRHYDPAYKYFSNFATAYEPLSNNMDVSIHPLGTVRGG